MYFVYLQKDLKSLFKKTLENKGEVGKKETEKKKKKKKKSPPGNQPTGRGPVLPGPLFFPGLPFFFPRASFSLRPSSDRPSLRPSGHATRARPDPPPLCR